MLVFCQKERRQDDHRRWLGRGLKPAPSEQDLSAYSPPDLSILRLSACLAAESPATVRCDHD